MIKQKISYYLMVICFLFLLPGLTQAAVTFSSSSGGNIDIGISIVLVGPGATEEYAEKVKQSIEEYWNKGAAAKSCYQINFLAEVKVGNESDYLKLTGESKEDFEIVGKDVKRYKGSEIWYVTDPKGGYYRSWVGADGNYDGHDSFGALSGNAGDEVIVHEAGHVFGLDDHYIDVYDENNNVIGFKMEEGYETNIMACSPYGDSIEDKFHYLNFEKMFEKIEERTGQNIRSCLMLNLKGDVGYELAEHVENFKADLVYGVRPNYPVVFDSDKGKEDINKLLGNGTGEAEWSLISMPPESLFIGFSMTNNPFNILVNGEIIGDDYNFNIVSEDNYIAESQRGVYHSGGTVDLIFDKASGFCDKPWNSLVNGMSLNIEEVSSDTICDFEIQHTFYDGDASLEILSIQ